jgi:SAM-dependent methyltransferase
MPQHGRRHRVFARWYPARAEAMDRAGFAAYRARLLAGLSGRVLELGAGSGLNFAHYPAQVERVVAIEPEPRLRELALAAAREAPVPVEVVAGDAADLSAFAGRFDAAVCSLVLCSVPDQRAALTQLRAVLRQREDGTLGEIRLLEHVRADGGALGLLQRVLDATAWPLIGAGCHCSRDVASELAGAGLAVRSVERFSFPPNGPTLPTSPHVLLVAVPERRRAEREA